MLVTIIIPVYNTSKYLSRCLESVLGQTHKELEIILINDGSTDNSGAIIDSYAAHDNRIITINQTNKGVSSARNAGLRKASGKYIQFVDSDDFVEKNYTEVLLDKINQKNVDMSVCDFTRFTVISDTDITSEIIHLKYGMKRREQLLCLPHSRYDSSKECSWYEFSVLWNRMYDGDIIRRNNITFDEKLHVHEDILFNVAYIVHISKACVISDCLYNYHHYKKREQIGSPRLASDLNNDLQQHEYSQLYNLLADNGASKKALEALEVYCCSQQLGTFIRACNKTRRNSVFKIYSVHRNICRSPIMCEFLKNYIPQAGASKVVPFFLKKKMLFLAIMAARFHG